MLSTQFLGIVAGLCTSTSLLPQFVKTLKEKKADDISIPMLLILLTGLALWLWYGIIKQDLPIILTNSFSLLVNIGVIILRFKYRKK